MTHRWPWVAALLVLPGCAEPLNPGEPGTARYFGEIRGETPMRLLPPRTDRAGNVYVLYGHPDHVDTTIYVGHVQGGWSGGCQAHRGIYGLHGFVGRTMDRMWYWTGDALVEVNSTTGACQEILANDPVTGTTLTYQSVIPWVRETPSRSTMRVLVQGATDDLPYHALIDVDEQLYSNLSEFQPSSAEDLVILGAGANPDTQNGYLLVSYLDDGEEVTESLRLDRDGTVDKRVSVDIDGETIDIDGETEVVSVQGELRVSDQGLVAGLLSDGSLVVINDEGGSNYAVTAMDPVGIQAWDGELWVTGTSSGTPVVARISVSGELGDPVEWSSAVTAEGRISQGMTVLDERSDPSRTDSWNTARTAISDHPLLSAHPLDVYTTDSTGWLVAGPSFSSTPEDMTAVAFVPIGVSFP